MSYLRTLYYGNGNCGIQGDGIISVTIKYRGAIEIKDKTPEGYYILTYKDKITITSMKIPHTQTLSDLFDYKGEFRIISVSGFSSDFEKSTFTIKKSMDYAELIDSKPDDMTIKSENMKAGYISKARVKKTTVDNNIIENLSASDSNIYYTSDGNVYKGHMHMHMKNGHYMTGAVHDENSQGLFFKRGNSLKSTKKGK